MSCKIEGPFLSSFTIEYLVNNLHINVQDIYGSPVRNAQVNINCNGILTSGTTDRNGCYLGLVVPGVVCDLTITKPCLFNYEQKFVLVDRTDINDPLKNFPIRVVDAGLNPVSNADVSIVSDIHNDTGQTDTAGFYYGKNEDEFSNALTVSKSGYQNFTYQMPPFIKIDCQDTGFSVASVVILNV